MPTSRFDVARAVFAEIPLRRAIGAYGAHAMAESAAWLALMVLAYRHGGVFEAGIVAAVQLAPAAAFAPLAAVWGERASRARILVAAYGLQVLLLVAAAVAAYVEAHRFLVYGAGAAFYLAVALTRPAMSALLPELTRRPEDLVAANAGSSGTEHLGVLLGPALAALLLPAGGPVLVFATTAGLTALAFIHAVRLPRPDVAPAAEPLGAGAAARIRSGIRVLAEEPQALLLVGCAAAPAVLLGAIEVLSVAASRELLGQGEHVAGYLAAAFGLGGLVGAGGAFSLVGRPRLVPALWRGGLLMGLPIVASGWVAWLPLMLGCWLVSGVGYSFAGVASTTLIQRGSSARRRGGLFGVFEGLDTAGLALGALLASLLPAWIGLRASLVVAGALVPLLLLMARVRLDRVDAAATVPDSEVLAWLQRDPIFRNLPAPVVERLAARAEALAVPAGAQVVGEGEIGDRYYHVVEGEFEVSIGGDAVRRLAPGEAFGEIALLRAVPRTATVRAAGPGRLVALRGEEFIEALTGHPPSHAHADATVDRLLEADRRREERS